MAADGSFGLSVFICGLVCCIGVRETHCLLEIINECDSLFACLHRYNASGRGYPDVSLLGHNYIVVLNSSFYKESGTSASAPVFAGTWTFEYEI
jgi:hypothetical protein